MGTEKLDSISCAHVEAEEGYRKSSSSRWQPYVNKASINTAWKVFLEIQAVFLWKNP